MQTRLAESPGRPLERHGNVSPREMTVHGVSAPGQNPAYRPAHSHSGLPGSPARALSVPQGESSSPARDPTVLRRRTGVVPQDDAREFLINLLDRASATGRPFWDATPAERALVRERFGTPAAALQTARTHDGAVRGVGAADLFLGTAILVEVATELLQAPTVGRTRQESVDALRERVHLLLG